jgi:hypothetical protein
MHVTPKSLLGREHTMTSKKLRTDGADSKALLAADHELLREVVRAAVREVL